MASLISWLDDRRKDIERGIGGVANEVGKAINSVVAPRPQQRPQPRPPVVRPPRPSQFNTGVGNLTAPRPPQIKPVSVQPGQPIQSPEDYMARTGKVAPSGSMLAADPSLRVKPTTPSNEQIKAAIVKRVQQQAGGSPTQRAASTVVNNTGKFVLGGTAKTLNTAAGGVALAGTELSGLAGRAFGTNAGNEARLNKHRQGINNALLKPGAGLFGAGGAMTVEDFRKGNSGDALRKGIGSGLQTSSEVLPIGKGIKLLSKAAPLTQKIAQGATQGALAGGIGNVGAQVVEGKQFDPMQALTSAGLGAALGAGIPIAGAGIQKVTPLIKSAVDIKAPVHAAAERASGMPRVHVLNDNEAFTLSDYADAVNGRGNIPPSVRAQIIPQARNAAKTAGFDVTNMSPKDVDRTVSSYLQARDNYMVNYKQAERQMLQGGYAKIPGNNKLPGDGSYPAKTPIKDLTPEQLIYKIASLEDRMTKPTGKYQNFFQRQLEEARARLEQPGGPTSSATSVDSVAQRVYPGSTQIATSPTIPANKLQLPRLGQQAPKSKVSQTNSIVAGDNIQRRASDIQPQRSRTYTDNTPVLDTKQYVKEMSKSQKTAMQGDSKIKTGAANFKATMIDDLAPIEDRLNKAIKNGAQVDPRDHITYQLDRSRRAEGITHAYIKDKGLDKIIQNVDNVKEFDQYLIARHAKELDVDVKTGRDSVKDAQLVQALDSKYKDVAASLYKYNQNLLDTSVEYGLISKQTAASLKKQYPDYVPFNRIFKEDELVKLQNNARADASISKQTAVQKIKGSERAISSPLNSIIDKTRVVVEQGERNKAAKLLTQYEKLDGNPFNLKEIPSTETIGTRSTISFLDNGTKRVFQVDDDIAEAAKHMSREQIGLIGRVIAMPARILRGGATGVNIGFAGANVVKDVIGAAINSRHPMRIADPRNFGKALAAALHHNGKHYQELMREGVAGTSFDLYRNPLKSSVGEIRSQKNVLTNIGHNAIRPQNWYRTLENTISRSEDFGRALQYYSNKSGYLADGKSDDVAKLLAGDQARNNSTNFFRSGSAGKHVNLAVPYWNAGVQGARIQIRRIKERPAQTLAKMAATIALPSTLIAMNNYGNDKNREVMAQIPEHEKKGSIIIVGPNATYNEKTRQWDDVYKIPVPPQHTGLHNSVQKAVESAYTGKEYDIIGVLGGVSENYTTIDPTNARAVANKITPQAAKLIGEPMTNTNFYTGNPIIPDSQKNLPAEDQSGKGTSGTAKKIGALTNVSPRALDNAFRTAAGGAGQNLLNISDTLLAASGAISKDDIRGTSVKDGVIGRFYGADKTPTSERIGKLFAGTKAMITDSAAYKEASIYDKQRMLNRLEEDLSAVEYNADGYGSGELTKKQQTLKDEGFKLDTYTNLESSSSSNTTPAEKYKEAKIAFDKESKDWSPVEKLKKTRELNNLAVQNDYDNDTVDLYSMNKGVVFDFVNQDKDGNKKVEQLLAYGDARVAAGLDTKNKFRDKYGNLLLQSDATVASGKSKAKSTKKAKASAKAAGKTNLSIASMVNKNRAPKVAMAPSFANKSGSTASYKKLALRKYTPKSKTPTAPKGVKVKKNIA